ncbi:MarR family transcriptional regulator [Cryobacterium adonitolivorans]|uniref:MarR family transcriptional regulator n=1 Tax=Cryobacterium adonitolivorans TaxID=1259189 RepID=A0A4R8W208_9MICO|nr:MarR family transcriptional regulator [Cryobacterium adonitolivorans]TFC01000.1 MarR family transcriptional regulator [Cryobacterium adonitolivorans]
MTVDQDWDRIDASLIRMRRLLGNPRGVTDGVDLSAVFVVDTIARRAKDRMSTRITDIARHLSVKPSTASRLVRSTEAAGYIQRSASPDDTRSVVLHLTSRGEELNTSARAFRADILRKATVTWDEKTIATFARLLDEFSLATSGSTADR